MRKIFPALLFIAAIPMALASSNFDTPEGAIEALETAYANNDIEAAVAAKDFAEEAKLMLLRLNPTLAGDPEVLKQTAEVLELGYRKQIRQDGFPDIKSLSCSLSKPERISDTLVKVTETCRFPDGSTSSEDVHVHHGANGWRVVIVP